MGRIVTPKYAVHVRTNDRGHALTPIAWRTRAQGQIPGDGRPTAANLAKWVEGYNASFRAGGSNAALSESIGFELRIHHAEIRENVAGGDVVAEWDAPLFEVVD